MRSARPVQAVLGAVAVVALLGCSEVPSSGEAKLIDRLATKPASPERPPPERARQLPQLPADKAPAEEIVRGFLAAQADPADPSRTTATEYLTTPSVWNPGAAEDVSIYALHTVSERRPGPRATSAGGGPDVTLVDVTFDLRARITPDGEFVPDVRQVRHTVELRGSEQRWRLSVVPAGLWLSTSSLDEAYRRVEPMFLIADQTRLVRDPVFLPRTAGGEVKDLVQRLIDGPTGRLRSSGASSPFPLGTTLKPVADARDGVQVLDFAGAFVTADAQTRSRIAAQLVWTITSEVDGVDAVEIRVDGEPFVLGDLNRGGPQRPAEWSQFAPDDGDPTRALYFAHGNSLMRLTSPSDVRRVRGLATTRQPAVDRADERVAVARPAGKDRGWQLLVGPIEGRLEPSLRAKHLTDPSWGRGDEGVWTVLQDGGRPQAWLVPQSPGLQPRGVFAFPDSDRVLAFEVAPDGVQVAVVVQRGKRRLLYAGLIHRSAQGRADGLSSLRPVAPEHDVTQVTWVDGRELAFIGRAAAAPSAVWRAAVDGSSITELEGSSSKILPERKGRERLLTRGDVKLIAVDHNVVYRYNGATWELDAPSTLGP